MALPPRPRPSQSSQHRLKVLGRGRVPVVLLVLIAGTLLGMLAFTPSRDDGDGAGLVASTEAAVTVTPSVIPPSAALTDGTAQSSPDPRNVTGDAEPRIMVDATPAIAVGVPSVAYERLPIPVEADTASSFLVETHDTERLEIALTFDCGSDRGYTEDILDLLTSYGIKGSFGMTGLWAEQNPDLVLRMAQEGHMIFNHTTSHGSFTGVSTGTGDPGTAFRIDEMEQTDQIVETITGGYDMRPYWRPPYGDVGPQTLRDLASIGYTITVLWTVDTLGWNALTGPEVYERVMNTLQPGQIVLMHVGSQASGDFDALPDIIETATAEGYALVTVDQLMQPDPGT